MDKLRIHDIAHALQGYKFMVGGKRFTVGDEVGVGSFGVVFKLTPCSSGDTPCFDNVVKVSRRPLRFDTIYDETPDHIFFDTPKVHPKSNPWQRMGIDNVKKLMKHHGITATSEEFKWWCQEVENICLAAPLSPAFMLPDSSEVDVARAHGRIVWIRGLPHSAILMGGCRKIPSFCIAAARKVLRAAISLGDEHNMLYVDANEGNFMMSHTSRDIRIVDLDGQWCTPLSDEVSSKINVGLLNALFLAISHSDSRALKRVVSEYMADKWSSVPPDLILCKTIPDWDKIVAIAVPVFLNFRLGDERGEELSMAMVQRSARAIRRGNPEYSSLVDAMRCLGYETE